MFASRTRNFLDMPSPVMIRPRRLSWEQLQAKTGIDSYAQLAAELGVTETTVRRVMAGTVEPSARFVVGALVAFPFASFERLFELYRRTA